MKHLIIIFLLIFSIKIEASKKFIVETDQAVSEILLINRINNREIKLTSKQADNTHFTFEANDLEGLFLKAEQSAYLKMYSVSEKISSAWHKIEEGKALEVKTLFLSNVFKNVELKEFYIKNFTTNPMTTSKSKLRDFGQHFFYTPNYFNFIKPENIKIEWKSGGHVLDLQIIDKENSLVLFIAKNYLDTAITYNQLQKLVFNEQHSYYLVINVLDSITQLQSTFNYTFQCNQFSFTNNQPIYYFINPHEFKFEWNLQDDRVDISIYNDKNELVFIQKNSNRDYIDFRFLKNSAIQFEKRKKYTIFVQTNGNKIFADFYFLLELDE